MEGIQVTLGILDKFLLVLSPRFGNLSTFFKRIFATFVTDASAKPLEDESLIWIQTKYFAKLSTLVKFYLEVTIRVY